MPWPGITDFSEAVQSPRLCFKGTELESGVVAVNRRGMPLVYSGAFACVYPVSVGGRAYAVRCFTREVQDQQARYNQLSDYLISALPPSFVHFEYLEHGISLGGSWYPIVKMEWVEGELLSSFVGSRLHEPDTLRRLAAQWRGGPAASLRGLRIAHNDLQHGNVMVQPDGNIRLVDYDGMFLPQFRGEDSPELGHKNFQHPLRSSEDYDDYVDNFPSLVIYLSLLAVASDPGLWDYYNDDNLIFTRNDYGDPGRSELFHRLKSSPDLTVAKLAERLEEYCALPVDEVPDLETILNKIPPITGQSPTAAPTTIPPPSAPATGTGYRQVLQAQHAPTANPTSTTGKQRPTTPQTASPTTTARPVKPTVTAPSKLGQGKNCSTCNRFISTAAAVCAYCGTSMAASSSGTVLPGPPTNRPTPASSTRDILDQLEDVAGIAIAALKRSAASGELIRVVLGVVATVVAVLAVMLAALMWMVSQRGW